VTLSYADLPALNATLNGLSALLITIGYILIRRGQRTLHKRVMISALVSSTAFLTSYVIYHAHIGSKPFPGTGPIRVIYFAILIPHVVLAAAIVPLVLLTTTRGLRAQYDRHVAIARWTLPLWLYVSVTGVIVYVMLYRLY
jgi:uncharacterized membrane protein YozB (DUF420 family)